MTRRCHVYFSAYASTLAQSCREAWQSRFAFFAHGGQVYFVLGPGACNDDWHPTGLEVKELVT